MIYLMLLADHIDGKACETVVGDMKALLHRDMLENDKTTQGIVKDTKELFVPEVFDPGIDKNSKKELFVSEVFDPGIDKNSKKELFVSEVFDPGGKIN